MNDLEPASSFADIRRSALEWFRWLATPTFCVEAGVLLPLIAASWWIAPGWLQALAMSAALVLVLVVEACHAAVERLAELAAHDRDPTVASVSAFAYAAVLASIATAITTWVTLLWCPGRPLLP